MWNPKAFIRWQQYNEMSRAFFDWLKTDPIMEQRHYAAMCSPRLRLIRPCSRSLARKFQRGR